MDIQKMRSVPTLTDLLFEKAEIGLCLVAPDGSILRANREWLRSTGFSLGDVLGADIVSLFPETRDMAVSLHARARAGYHVEVSRHAQRIDGRDTWWEGSLDPVPMEGGTGLLVTAREVTGEERGRILGCGARPHLDAPTLDIEAQLLTFLDQTGDAFFLHDFEGRFLDVNHCACERLGYTREELLRMTVMDVEQDFDLAAAQRQWAKIRPGEPFMLHGHNRRKDGTTVPVEVRFACLDINGQRLFFGLNRDITDRVRAETSLRESELLYKSLFTVAPAGVVVLDENGQLYAFNDQAHEYLGYTREEFGKLRVSDIDPDEGPDEVRQHVLQIIEARSAEFDARHRSKSGELKRVRVRARAMQLGGKWRVLAVWQDVTEQKRTEEALRESESLYRSLFTLAPSGVIVLDQTGQFRAFNDQAHEYLGYTREEFAKLKIPDIDPDRSPEDVHRRVLEIFEAGSAEFDARHRAKSGELRQVRVRTRVVELGGKRRLLSVWQDVTERKQWEEALRASEARLLAAFEATPDAINITRLRDSVYTAVNDGFERLSGWARSDIIGKTALQVGIWVDLEQRRRLLEGLAGRNSVQTVETTFRRKDGSLFTAWLSARTFEADGERFVLAITRDISDLRRAEAALRDADHRKDNFLGMLSHELRNPLAPIRNALYILDHAEPSGQQARRAKEVANRQLAHITRLVDDLLDVTRIARGKIQLRRSGVDLAELARRTAEDHRALMQDRGIELRLVIPPAPVVVNGDETRLAQVLGNLLHNASKFTPADGHVALTVGHQGGSAVVHVRDTGVGMDVETLRTLFEPFTQAKQTLARSEGGLGLGLALVKGLVTMHGGDVSARSAGVGRGTEFVLTLPLDRRHSIRARPPQRGGERARAVPRHVLVVDDSHDAAATLAELLEMEGHKVAVAHDGPSALALAQAHAPDVVLCDIGLPGMDGYEVARQLRARGQPGLRLVAVSGYAQPEDLVRASEAGFDAHVAKPPDPEELARLLA
jgi:PAS domain S-box-containing protein